MLNKIIDGVAHTPAWKAHVLPFYKEQCNIEARAIINEVHDTVIGSIHSDLLVRIEKYLNVTSQLENIDVRNDT